MISAGRDRLGPVAETKGFFDWFMGNELNCAHPGVTGAVPNLTTESAYTALLAFSDKKMEDLVGSYLFRFSVPPYEMKGGQHKGGMSDGIDVGAEYVCFHDTDIMPSSSSAGWHWPWDASWSDYNVTFKSGILTGRSISYQDIDNEWTLAWAVDYRDEQKHIFDTMIDKGHMDKWLPSAVYLFGQAFGMGNEVREGSKLTGYTPGFSILFKDAAIAGYMKSATTYLADVDNHSPTKRASKDAEAFSDAYKGMEGWGTDALIMLEAFAQADMKNEDFLPVMKKLAEAGQEEFSKVLSAGKSFNEARAALKKMVDAQKELETVKANKELKYKERKEKIAELETTISSAKLAGQTALKAMAELIWETNEDGSLKTEVVDERDRAKLKFDRDKLNVDQDYIVEVMERGYLALLEAFGRPEPKKTGGTVKPKPPGQKPPPDTGWGDPDTAHVK